MKAETFDQDLLILHLLLFEENLFSHDLPLVIISKSSIREFLENFHWRLLPAEHGLIFILRNY